VNNTPVDKYAVDDRIGSRFSRAMRGQMHGFDHFPRIILRDLRCKKVELLFWPEVRSLCLGDYVFFDVDISWIVDASFGNQMAAMFSWYQSSQRIWSVTFRTSRVWAAQAAPSYQGSARLIKSKLRGATNNQLRCLISASLIPGYWANPTYSLFAAPEYIVNAPFFSSFSRLRMGLFSAARIS